MSAAEHSSTVSMGMVRTDHFGGDNDMVERVALAIYREFENRPRYARVQMNDLFATELARAAMRAMKYADGTDEGMLCAISASEAVDPVSLACAWDRMIDAALSEGAGET